jgi:hypothetical protein
LRGRLVKRRKSSRSGAQGGGNCVEIAESADRVQIRDSKAPEGGTLSVSRAAWREFLGGVKA